MNESLLIETRETDDGMHRIKVYVDDDAQCPIEDWEMTAGHLLEYGGRNHCGLIGDWKEWFSANNRETTLEEAVRRIAAEHVEQKDIVAYLKAGEVSGVRFIYDRHERLWELQTQRTWGERKGEWDEVWPALQMEPYELKDCDCRAEFLEHFDKDECVDLIERYARDIVIREWSSSGYCQGDWMECVSYVTKERYDKTWNANAGKDWRKHAMEMMEAEVKAIEMWAWGDVKGFVLEKRVRFTKVFDEGGREDERAEEWEYEDSCWGFFMETDELFDHVMKENGLMAS